MAGVRRLGATPRATPDGGQPVLVESIDVITLLRDLIRDRATTITWSGR
jgi:hypothetical protein